MNVIGICGQKNSGKSTVARMVLELVPGTVEIQLAEPLKRFCADVFDWKDDVLNGPSEMREKPDERYRRWVSGALTPESGRWEFLTPRYALQRLGTEWGRDCYQDVWIDYALRRASRIFAEGWMVLPGTSVLHQHVDPRSPGLQGEVPVSLVVVPDVRFINEARKIREAGGQVWRVRRDNLGVTNADAHASEVEQFSPVMDPFIDWDIINDRTLDALREDVRLRLSVRLRLRRGATPY